MADQRYSESPQQDDAGFTRADLDSFLADHAMLWQTTWGGEPTVLEFQLMPAAEASARLLDVSVGCPDDAAVCWVRLQGPFDFGAAGPAFLHDPASPMVPMPPAPAVILLFEARTGRPLLMGPSM
jgi:hypothetical protein